MKEERKTSLSGKTRQQESKPRLAKKESHSRRILEVALAVNIFSLLLFFQSCGKRTTDSEASDPYGVTANSMPIIVQYNRPSSTLSDDDLLEIATRYKAVSDCETCFSGGQMAELRRIDPEIVIFRYLNSAAVYRQRDIEEILSRHPDWVMRDEFGEPLSSRLHEGGIMMDPSSDGWRGYLVGMAYKACLQTGYDGIFLDEVLMVNELDPDFKGINTKTGEPYTTGEYRDDQHETVGAIKDTIGSDKLLVLNNVKRGSGYFEQQPYRFLEASDGVVSEGFRGPPGWPLNRYLSEDEWVQNVEMMRNVESRGEHMVAVTKVLKEVADDQTRLRELDLFMYTTFLLGMGELSYYTSGVEDPADSLGENLLYYDYWWINAGEPLSSYEKNGSHYQRDFEKARVLVNPTDSPANVGLGGRFTTLSGQAVSEITLEAHTGTILLKSISTPGQAVPGNLKGSAESNRRPPPSSPPPHPSAVRCPHPTQGLSRVDARRRPGGRAVLSSMVARSRPEIEHRGFLTDRAASTWLDSTVWGLQPLTEGRKDYGDCPMLYQRTPCLPTR